MSTFKERMEGPRVIKFKARSKHCFEWVYGHYFMENGEHLIMSEHGVKYVIDRKTLCQSTGMVDKFGLEVYEHDKLFEDGFQMWVVSFKYGGLCVEYDDDAGVFQMRRHFDYMEICGNAND